MKKYPPKIKEVKIIGSEIVLTVHPPLDNKDILVIYENVPNSENSSNIGQIFGPGNKVIVPFNRLSPRPVEEYYLVYSIGDDGGIEKIENDDFNKALLNKVTLYDIGDVNSSSKILCGHTTPGTLVNIKSYDFIGRPSNVVGSAMANKEGLFNITISPPFYPYKPYLVEANGVYYSPNEKIVVDKLPNESELIANGSFQNGLTDWLRNPFITDEAIFEKGNGYGNFKLIEGESSDGGNLEAVQFVEGKTKSKYRLSCEIKTHNLTSSPYHTLYLGEIIVSGGPNNHTKHELTENEIGEWILLTFDFEFVDSWPIVKYGFTTSGIAEIDVKNVSMKEI